MSRRLDIGIASYRNAAKLRATIASIEQMTVSDWRLFIIHNPSDGDEEVWQVINDAQKHQPRIVAIQMDKNVGYAGAVNELLIRAETDYVAYCDNDIEIRTPGWDDKLCQVLDENPECGWMFPGPGHYGFHNGRYHECLWNAGYCWILRSSARKNRAAAVRVKPPFQPCENGSMAFDVELGHHEEVDYMIRLRLAGFQIGCRPDVQVIHHETATNANSADHKPGGRIHDGVVRWMNKWNGYFCGAQLKYSMTAYDPRALRYTDWPPCALYLERMTLANFPHWNQKPGKVNVPGVGLMDAVQVLKPEGPYKGRAI